MIFKYFKSKKEWFHCIALMIYEFVYMTINNFEIYFFLTLEIHSRVFGTPNTTNIYGSIYPNSKTYKIRNLIKRTINIYCIELTIYRMHWANLWILDKPCNRSMYEYFLYIFKFKWQFLINIFTNKHAKKTKIYPP